VRRRFSGAAVSAAVVVAGAWAWMLASDASAPAAVPPAPPAATVQERPFLLAFPRVEQAAARMTYVLADGSRHTLGNVVSSGPVPGGRRYVVATDEAGREAHVTVLEGRYGIRVEWRLVPDDDVVEVHEAFSAPEPQHFLGSGGREEYVDLRAQIVPLKVSFDCGGTLLAPYVASSAGWALRIVSTATGQVQLKGWQAEEECKPWLRGRPLCALTPSATEVRLCLRARSLTYEIYTGGFAANLARFTARTGRARVPPRDQFALVKWRDAVDHSDELLEDADQLQRRGIPLGWVLLDNPWERPCFGTLAWDRERIPDPKGTIDALHARGVKLMLWVSPYVACPPSGYPQRALLGQRNTRTIDLTDAAARALYTDRLRAVFALGVDGVKGDRGDEHELEPEAFAGGEGATLHNRYPTLFGEAVLDALRDVRGPAVSAIFRAGWSGSQRTVPGFWGGDQDGTWEGLARAIRSGQTAGVSGYPIWGPDVGGYRSEGLTPDLFVRWAQFGAVSPVFEVGGRGPHARFWQWGDEVVARFRRAAVLHYELFPHLWELAHRSWRGGTPILRPLGWNFPRDPGSWAAELQLLVGPDLLAAPVTRPGTRPRVYLPPATWVDVWRGTTVRGPRTLTRPTPLDELPLYLRAGAAISFNFRSPELWASPWRVNDLERTGRAGWLLAPGPRTDARARGAGRLQARRRGARLDVVLTGSPREAQVLVLRRTAPRAVSIGGRRVPRARSLAQLRRSASGWTHVRGPSAGVVVKLGPRAPRAFTLIG
jgi:alpha-D-xyloside xylohydrolase